MSAPLAAAEMIIQWLLNGNLSSRSCRMHRYGVPYCCRWPSRRAIKQVTLTGGVSKKIPREKHFGLNECTSAYSLCGSLTAIQPPNMQMQVPLNYVQNSANYPPFQRPKERKADGDACFRRGSHIELSSGALRRVEDIRTEDFIQSALRSHLFDLREATVVKIDRSGSQSHHSMIITFSYDTQHSKVHLEVQPGHPLFVYGQGWASCHPELSFKLYELKCQQLQVGDICLSLVPREQVPVAVAPLVPNTSPVPLMHSYEVYAEMANLVAAYTQQMLGKLRN